MKMTGLSALMCGASIFGLAACDAPERDPRLQMDEEVAAVEPAGPPLAEVLAANPDLSTLNSLIQESNMGPFIDGSNSFTLFAPTNAAFEKLDAGTLEFLTAPENAKSLKQVLGYHLLRNDMKAGALIAAIEGGSDDEARMTSSNSFQIIGKMNDEGAPILVDANGDEAGIVETDLTASNGSIHVIDAVLMPPKG